MRADSTYSEHGRSATNHLLDAHKELNSVDPNTVAKVDMYASIASQSASAPTDIKDTIESPVLESAQILSVTTSTVQKERTRIAEPNFASNKFASNKFAILMTSEEEGDSTDSEKETDLINLLAPSEKKNT